MANAALRWPALRGALLALLAAVLFGISTPLVQRLGAGLGAFGTAALLYAGAAAVGLVLRRPAAREARLLPKDLPRIGWMALLGAVLGPVALAWGLQHTNGASASLMLTLEAVFTALLARWLYRESMDRRVRLALLLMTAGGALLVLDQGRAGATPLLGLLAVLGATVAWGADNTLSRPLAERDPAQVVLGKAVLGAAATTALAFALHEPRPSVNAALALLATGAAGYGLSLRFYLLAQRAFGAARTGSVFAFAPFIGAALAFGMGERSTSAGLVAGCVLMLLGVALHLTESHAHAHRHDALEHEHAHRHDDGHHNHRHEPARPPERRIPRREARRLPDARMPSGAHSHRHAHEPLQHAHAHVPDAHHLHPH